MYSPFSSLVLAVLFLDCVFSQEFTVAFYFYPLHHLCHKEYLPDLQPDQVLIDRPGRIYTYVNNILLPEAQQKINRAHIYAYKTLLCC